MARPTDIIILGSTGSIGRQTLDVIDSAPELWNVRGLVASRSWELLVEQYDRYNPDFVYLEDPASAARFRQERPEVSLAHDWASLMPFLSNTPVDFVMSAIVGMAGLRPTLVLAQRGVQLGLANKESLIVGGRYFLDQCQRFGTDIIPVDSEHSAIAQCLRGRTIDEVSELVLTGSGGPFRGRTREGLATVSVDEALRHPSWAMGPKITIDSSTLMNKGLEVIEAHLLFGVGYDSIKVWVHPQSILHSGVIMQDGSFLGQLGKPDMTLPIQYAMYLARHVAPKRKSFGVQDLQGLTFEEVDWKTFGCLGLAYEAGREGGSAPLVLNASNEVAVQAFLAGSCSYLAIEDCVAHCLETVPRTEVDSFEAILVLDRKTRTEAARFLR